jgi:hypothetical protein
MVILQDDGSVQWRGQQQAAGQRQDAQRIQSHGLSWVMTARTGCANRSPPDTHLFVGNFYPIHLLEAAGQLVAAPTALAPVVIQIGGFKR